MCGMFFFLIVVLVANLFKIPSFLFFIDMPCIDKNQIRLTF